MQMRFSYVHVLLFQIKAIRRLADERKVKQILSYYGTYRVMLYGKCLLSVILYAHEGITVDRF